MADQATFVSMNQTVEILGGSRTRAVFEFGYQTIGHDIYFEFRIPTGTGLSPSGDVIGPRELSQVEADDYASFIEAAFLHPGVADMVYTQGVNLAGNLLDFMDILLVSDDGQSSAVWQQPLGLMDGQSLFPKIDPIIAQLNGG